MEETLKISYMNCGFCTAKNHCAACGEELAQSLAEKPGVTSARINIPNHSAEIVHSMDSGELEDLLDGMGLLVG